MSALGEMLRLLRGSMSQSELASKLHIDRSTVSKVEGGAITPSEEIVNLWLEVTYDNFLRIRAVQAMYADMEMVMQKHSIIA